MNSLSSVRPLAAEASNAALSLRRLPDRQSWTRWVAPLASVAVLTVALYQLRGLSPRAVIAMVPQLPLFWTLFAGRFLLTPITEWIIYRRLWRLPLHGIGALIGKLVSNELLLGYLGEIYFYAWVRRHLRLSGSPFGAIKDVAILSAIAGNIATLALVAAVYPLVASLDLGLSREAWLGSFVVIVGSSLVITILRRRLFTLPRRDLWFILLLHGARIVTSIALTAMLWHLLLPDIGFELWLLLATVRQLVSRLPLVPNKDIVFAGVTAFVVGGGGVVTAAMALMATLSLVANLIAGVIVGLRGVATEAAA